MYAIDTDVLIYYLNSDEVIKQGGAKELIDRLTTPSELTVMPWQVAGELLNWLAKWKKLAE